ncbi:hypothetical protein CAEBREN_31431 [Caenorhabditis brenneri]|uniref:Uncharacterized protein n=1 Tax=Caenorhabditis brenneri TaxID=135651 RepID=G0NVX4_CAEBE|nr:hypothetical protein CAEBREN_31431 [Caenorhabditis brenneri]
MQVVEKVEIVHEEIEVPDKETEEKLKNAQSRIKELEAEMKSLNSKIRKEKRKNDANTKEEGIDEPDKFEEFKEFLDEEVQTEWVSPLSPHLSHLNNEEETEEIPKSAKSEKVKRLEEEMQLLQELVAKSDSKDGENMRQKSEIRDLKARIQRLTKTNKELLVTCEQIKEDALAELSTFRRNNETSDERKLTDLRIELERLRLTCRTLKNANEELKVELNRLKQQADKKDQKNEPDEWERRKRQDEMISSLRDKLKKKETLEKEYIEKLKKREMVIETMRNDQGIRSSEIEKLQRKLKSTDPAAIKQQSNKEWKEKLDILEATITKKNEELAVSNRNLLRVKSEFETFKSKHVTEIEKLTVDHKENLRKEISRAREEVKKSMSLIRPSMNSIETQTNIVFMDHKASGGSTDRRSSSHRQVDALSSSSSSSSSSKTSSRHEKPKSTIKTPKSSSRTPVDVISDRRSSQKTLEKSESLDQHYDNFKLATPPTSDRADYYQLKESLQTTKDRLMESQEKLIQMEKDYLSLYEKFDRLTLRFERDKEEKPTGAVLVLSDKLAAKDREIAQLKNMSENLDAFLNLAYASFNLLFPVLAGYSLIQCAKKPAAGSPSAPPKTIGESKSSKEGVDKPVEAPNAPKAPADKDAVAGTHDPNYQTLAGVDGNVFQEKGKAAAPAGGAAPTPKAGGPGMAATHDPNYQTLAGIGNDCFDKKK